MTPTASLGPVQHNPYLTQELARARTEGSAIRRIGHRRWLRNLAVALGNGPMTLEVRLALAARTNHPDPLVREHVQWALARQAEDTQAEATGVS